MGGRGGSCSESVPEYEPVSNCATGTVTTSRHAMPRVLTNLKHAHWQQFPLILRRGVLAIMMIAMTFLLLTPPEGQLRAPH